MKSLANLIKGLQIIEKEEGQDVEFNSQDGILFIGKISTFSVELSKLGFDINNEFECMEYNLD